MNNPDGRPTPKAKPSIEYATDSLNPYSGCEGINNGRCAVGKKCWAYKRSLMLAGRFGYPKKPNNFKPTFHPDKLKKIKTWRTPQRIACCFMSDIAYAKTEWLEAIMGAVRYHPQHTFYFLTKEPAVLAAHELTFPDNAWIGVTLNRQREVGRIVTLDKLVHAKHKMVSFEPIYEEIIPRLDGIEWIFLGAQTNPELQPKKIWVDRIIMLAKMRNIKIFMKDNLSHPAPIREFPESILKAMGD